MEPKDLEALLFDRARLPLRLKGTYRSPVTTDSARSYLGETREISTHNYAVLDDLVGYHHKVFGWIKGNPSEPDLRSAIQSVFHFSQSSRVDPHNLVNTVEGHQRFLQVMRRTEPQTVFLLGGRGSGKTFYLNYLINTATYDLYDTPGLLIYRLDASKLYRQNAQVPIAELHSKGSSLESYLYLHIAYVTFKYHASHPVWQELIADVDGEFERCLLSICEEEPRYLRDSIDFVRDYSAFLTTLEDKLGNGTIDQQALSKIMDDPERLLDSELLSRAILRYTQRKGFHPLFMFDGVDNIDLHLWRPLYDHFLGELSAFCNRDDKPNPYGAHIVIALRTDTYNHMRKRHQLFFRRHHTLFRTKVHEIRKVLTLKAQVAIEPASKYFADMHSDIDYEDGVRSIEKQEGVPFILRDQSEFHRVLLEFAEDYIDRLIEAYNHILPRRNSPVRPLRDDRDLFSRLYNNNLRSFLCNFINVFSYRLLFLTKKDRYHTPRYILTEGVLLNGNLYLNSEDPRPSGQCIPNIFWFESEKCNGRWHGLCLYHLLALLSKNDMVKKDMCDILSEYGYSRQIIDERLNAAIEYGLVELSYVRNDDTLQLAATGKGRFIQQLPFIDIDTFYYMALDTPLVSSTLESSATVRYHDNTEVYWGNYTEACVLTSITLIRHILAHQREAVSRGGEVFELPPGFPGPLIRGLEGHMRQPAFAPTKRRRDELVRDLRGLV